MILKSKLIQNADNCFGIIVDTKTASVARFHHLTKLTTTFLRLLFSKDCKIAEHSRA